MTMVSGICFVTSQPQIATANSIEPISPISPMTETRDTRDAAPPKRKYRPRGERTRKEQHIAAQTQYYHLHRTKIRKYASEYYRRNKTKILSQQLEYKRQKKILQLSPEDSVYIAGPMTGKPLLNFPAFYSFAGLIENLFGSKVFNPARHPMGLTFDEYIQLDIQDLQKCNKAIFLNGWRKSKGALIEREFCRKHHIRMYSQRDLVKVLKNKIEP